LGTIIHLRLAILLTSRPGVRENEKLPERVSLILDLLPRARTSISTLLERDPSTKAFIASLPERSYVTSAFLALRVIRAHADIEGVEQVHNPTYRDFFDAKLHEQLSFSSIPDSRFDPAELAFCLEGLLTCAREAVDPVLFERVLNVLGANQQTSAYWRPNRPFIAHDTGEIVLPISVEGANSLLRSLEIVDRKKLYDTFDSAALPMFRRFWQWLRARKVEISCFDATCVGWHSEHINEAGVMHLWDTSQVLEVSSCI
jgi:hypothetical protein